MFHIAAFAALAGVSAKVLRDYDAGGLFRPAWIDPDTGYRLYSPAQLPELRRILALRDVGVSLAEIRQLIAGGSELGVVLERRRQALEDERRDADRRLARLGISIVSHDSGGPDVVVRDIPAELVATMDVTDAGGDVGRAFYELELRIRDTGVRAPRPPGALAAERSLTSDGPAIEVFVPIRRAAAGLEVRRLPAIRAATILHRGAYETVGATRRALRAWLGATGQEAADPVRTIYLQFGAEEDLRLPAQFLVNQAADLLTEIQVPIQ
jgi:DNA-binding transcriptional MerR regulator